MGGKKRLLTNGFIWTADPRLPEAESVAVVGDTIEWVGAASDCRKRLGGGYEEFDLQGGALLPGFYDAHLHPLSSIVYTMNTNLLGVGSIEEIVEKLRCFADGHPEEQWIAGLNFDEQAMAEPRLPNRRDLDRISRNRPVIVVKHDGHSLIANTRAMETAGITADTVSPPGGSIDRGPDGAPDGVFREAAVRRIFQHLPMPAADRLLQGAAETFQGMLGMGITSLGVILQSDEHGPAGSIGAFDIPVMQMLRDAIPQSIYALVIAKDPARILPLRRSNLHSQDRWRHSRVAGLKIIADGTFGSCTAAMIDPFSDHPDRSGFLLLEEETIYRRMTAAHRAGMQIAVHAIGDAANRIVIDLYDRLLREHPRPDHRHRIEHASIMDPSMIADARRLGLVLCMQPMFIHSEQHWIAKRLGPERLRWTYPFAALRAAGIPVAGSSDSPVESQNVLHAVQCCVSREGFAAEEKISVAAALEMFTSAAAWAQFEEEIKGSITPGKRADLVQLTDNPLQVPVEALSAIGVLRTWIGGELCYER